MKVTDIQLMMVIRGLYREGHKTLTIKEIRERICMERYHQEWSDSEVAEWLLEAEDVRRGSGVGWDVWNFSDRFRRAFTRLAKTGRIKVEGEKKKGGYSINSKVHLCDYTIKQMFGKDALRYIVTHKAS